MACDLTGGYQQTASLARPDQIRDAVHAIAVVSHARDLYDARLLLDALGLLHAAPTARALLKLSRPRPT